MSELCARDPSCSNILLPTNSQVSVGPFLEARVCLSGLALLSDRTRWRSGLFQIAVKSPPLQHAYLWPMLRPEWVLLYYSLIILEKPLTVPPSRWLPVGWSLGNPLYSGALSLCARDALPGTVEATNVIYVFRFPF